MREAIVAGPLTAAEEGAVRERLYALLTEQTRRYTLGESSSVPVELAEELMRRREEQTHTIADIHERNDGYLRQCRATAAEAAGFYGWTVVPCARDGVLRSIVEIHEEIYAHVKKCMEG